MNGTTENIWCESRMIAKWTLEQLFSNKSTTQTLHTFWQPPHYSTPDRVWIVSSCNIQKDWKGQFWGEHKKSQSGHFGTNCRIHHHHHQVMLCPQLYYLTSIALICLSFECEHTTRTISNLSRSSKDISGQLLWNHAVLAYELVDCA